MSGFDAEYAAALDLIAEQAATIARVRALADDLLREMTSNIPLGPPDWSYDPHDEFRRCAIDRRERVARWHSRFLAALDGTP